MQMLESSPEVSLTERPAVTPHRAFDLFTWWDVDRTVVEVLSLSGVWFLTACFSSALESLWVPSLYLLAKVWLLFRAFRSPAVPAPEACLDPLPPSDPENLMRPTSVDAHPIYSKFHDKRRKIAAADRGLKDLQRKARLGLPAETSQFEWIKGKVSFLREWSKEGVDEEFEANTKELLSLSDPGLFECLQVGTENGRSYRDWSSKLSRAPEALGRLWAAEVVESFVATLCLLKSLGYRVSTLTLS